MSEETTPETPPAFDVTAFSDADLATRHAATVARGRELSALETHTEEEAAEFATLAERLPMLSAEITTRNERAAANQAARESFASAPELSITPVTPVKAPESAPEPVPAPEVPVVPSVSQMAVQTPAAPPAAPAEGIRTTAYVSPMAAGLLNVPVDSVYADSGDVSLALIKNAGQFGVKGAPGTTQTIAQYRREGRKHVIDTLDGQQTMQTLREARRESQFASRGGNLARAWQKAVDETGSLTAAAGWCAPSQNDYDLCLNWDSPVGILDLPTVTVTRGGINYTDEPTFPQIYANAVAAGGGSNFLTEAQVIADTAKTCSEIPCPTFENRRLDVMALCIRVSFLQAAGYPEVVNAWESGLRASHEAEMNRLIIADILARAGAATVIAPAAGAVRDSFTSGLLEAVELAAEDIRYQFHMSWNATVEVALPHWVIPQIRSDLSRRTGDTGGLLNVSDSYIASLFTTRGVRVHWVRGWQDGLITGGALDPTFPGGDAATPFMTALPENVSFLAWPAGSIAVARQDVVTLTNVYDAASLAQNEFTSLFAEEGFAPVYPCPGQRLYTVNQLCTQGTTGAANLACAVAV